MKSFITKIVILVFLTLMCTSCYQGSSNGHDDLITIPVTNNPNIIPEKGEAVFPNAMPY